MKKQIGSLLLSAVMVITMLPTAAFAQSTANTSALAVIKSAKLTSTGADNVTDGVVTPTIAVTIDDAASHTQNAHHAMALMITKELWDEEFWDPDDTVEVNGNIKNFFDTYQSGMDALNLDYMQIAYTKGALTKGEDYGYARDIGAEPGTELELTEDSQGFTLASIDAQPNDKREYVCIVWSTANIADESGLYWFPFTLDKNGNLVVDETTKTATSVAAAGGTQTGITKYYTGAPTGATVVADDATDLAGAKIAVSRVDGAKTLWYAGDDDANAAKWSEDQSDAAWVNQDETANTSITVAFPAGLASWMTDAADSHPGDAAYTVYGYVTEKDKPGVPTRVESGDSVWDVYDDANTSAKMRKAEFVLDTKRPTVSPAANAAGSAANIQVNTAAATASLKLSFGEDLSVLLDEGTKGTALDDKATVGNTGLLTIKEYDTADDAKGDTNDQKTLTSGTDYTLAYTKATDDDSAALTVTFPTDATNKLADGKFYRVEIPKDKIADVAGNEYDAADDYVYIVKGISKADLSKALKAWADDRFGDDKAGSFATKVTYDGAAAEIAAPATSDADVITTYLKDSDLSDMQSLLGALGATGNAAQFLPGAATLTATFYKDNSGSISTTKTDAATDGASAEGKAPKNAGAYWLTLSVPDSTAFMSGSVNIPFTVTPKEVKLPDSAYVTKTYDGKTTQETSRITNANDDTNIKLVGTLEAEDGIYINAFTNGAYDHANVADCTAFSFDTDNLTFTAVSGSGTASVPANYTYKLTEGKADAKAVITPVEVDVSNMTITKEYDGDNAFAYAAGAASGNPTLGSDPAGSAGVNGETLIIKTAEGMLHTAADGTAADTDKNVAASKSVQYSAFAFSTDGGASATQNYAPTDGMNVMTFGSTAEHNVIPSMGEITTRAITVERTGTADAMTGILGVDIAPANLNKAASYLKTDSLTTLAEDETMDDVFTGMTANPATDDGATPPVLTTTAFLKSTGTNSEAKIEFYQLKTGKTELADPSTELDMMASVPTADGVYYVLVNVSSGTTPTVEGNYNITGYATLDDSTKTNFVKLNVKTPPTPPSGGGSSGGTSSYTVKFDAGKNGKITKGNASTSVSSGSKVAASKVPEVTANEGYKFLGWSLDGKTTVDPTAQKITKSVTFTALYEGAETPELNKDEHMAYIKGYTDGAFKPGNDITRAEVAAIFARIVKNEIGTDGTTSFSDVKTDAWYAPSVAAMQKFGMLKGYPDGTFRPDAPITREEFTAMATRMGEITKAGSLPFADVKADSWSVDNIYTAYTAGWIAGYEDGTFRPSANLTRAEAVKMVNAMLERSITAESIEGKQYKTFSDVPSTHWAYLDVIEAANAHAFTKDAGKETWK